jgi:hypothetical protein
MSGHLHIRNVRPLLLHWHMSLAVVQRRAAPGGRTPHHVDEGTDPHARLPADRLRRPRGGRGGLDALDQHAPDAPEPQAV